ncbi:DUF4326 domain-containing protein [Streptomyces rubiginosohelvolus]|uniref:DUF4326 domain-containing protein n=1 Tax=Streptomyces rubiginosohelvolus TaxID=67362 RepID=UPI0036CC55E4
MARYDIEFGALGDTRPVPNLTVQTTDLNVLGRAVVEHARPHITPVLTELGRPELADCLFRMNKDRTMGQFLHLNLVTGMAAEFLPARITTTPERIQRKRTKGWSKGSAVIVSRPSRFGNPFTIKGAIEAEWSEPYRACAENYSEWLRVGTEGDWYQETYQVGRQVFDRRRVLDELHTLRGKDLACTCPLPADGEPDHCHAAVLLKLANAPKEN